MVTLVLFCYAFCYALCTILDLVLWAPVEWIATLKAVYTKPCPPLSLSTEAFLFTYLLIFLCFLHKGSAFSGFFIRAIPTTNVLSHALHVMMALQSSKTWSCKYLITCCCSCVSIVTVKKTWTCSQIVIKYVVAKDKLIKRKLLGNTHPDTL